MRIFLRILHLWTRALQLSSRRWLKQPSACTSPMAQDTAMCCQSEPLLPAAAAQHLLSKSHSPSGSWLCHPFPNCSWRHTKRPVMHTLWPHCCLAKSLAPPCHPQKHSHTQELHPSLVPVTRTVPRSNTITGSSPGPGGIIRESPEALGVVITAPVLLVGKC